jgi:hypothetical protein
MQAKGLRRAGLVIAIWLPPMSVMAQAVSPTFELSIVRPGSDYKEFDSGPDPRSCQRSGMTDPQCHAWSYEKPTCWLKNRVPLPAISPNMVSGVVRR